MTVVSALHVHTEGIAPWAGALPDGSVNFGAWSLHFQLRVYCGFSCKWKCLSRVQLFVIQWTHSPWNSLGQNTRVGSRSLLQGTVYQLSHKGIPSILKWVVYPFSRGPSQPRNWTWVSCIAGGFFTNWAIRECNGTNFPLSHTGFCLPGWLSLQMYSHLPCQAAALPSPLQDILTNHLS